MRQTERRLAVLFAYENGPYAGIKDIEIWGETKNALNYKGPYPVIAHPPCARWGRFWYGSSIIVNKYGKRYEAGDDKGYFAHALWAVRTFGGILEHPKDSKAWKAFGLIHPPQDGGWIAAGDFVGWTCCVEQGFYGHITRKPTWLYAVNCNLPSLKWGKYMQEKKPFKLLSHRQRAQTPIPFRDLLISIARTALVLFCSITIADQYCWYRVCEDQISKRNCKTYIEQISAKDFKEKIFAAHADYECWPMKWGRDYLKRPKPVKNSQNNIPKPK